MGVAKTITYQINTIDPTAFSKWNADGLVGFPESEDSLGALIFSVKKCPSFKGKAYIRISLRQDDTYSIRLSKPKNLTKRLKQKILTDPDISDRDLLNIIGERDSIYAENLVETIDSLLGLK